MCHTKLVIIAFIVLDESGQLMHIAIVSRRVCRLIAETSLAEIDSDVACVDIDGAKVAIRCAGHAPIYEPGLGELFMRNLAEERLTSQLIQQKTARAQPTLPGDTARLTYPMCCSQ